MDVVKCIGVSVHGANQRIFVHSNDMISLVNRTVALIKCGECTAHCMSILVGHWCWYLLLKRPLLSLLQRSYRFIQTFGRDPAIKSIWTTIQRELLLICCLSPLLQIDLNSIVSPRVIATDASMSGFGVMSNPMNVDDQSMLEVELSLSQLCGHVGLSASECDSSTFSTNAAISSVIDLITVPFTNHQPVISLTNVSRLQHGVQIANLVRQVCDQVDWITIMAGRWKYNNESTHINELELSSVLLAVRWICSLVVSRGRGRRVVMLVDNAVVKYSVMKGRSSSVPLLKLLRRIAAVCLVMDVTLRLVYVPSSLNPADAASRAGQSINC